MRKRVSFHHTRDIINRLSGLCAGRENLGDSPTVHSVNSSKPGGLRQRGVKDKKTALACEFIYLLSVVIVFASFQSSFLKSLSFISANSITIRTYPLLLLKIRMQARIILSLLRILSPLLPSQTKLLSFL